jgi:hypothetical protein
VVIKIIVPFAGSVTDQRTAGYVINIAKRLKAQLLVLRVLTENETEAEGKQSPRLFIENGKAEKVPVNGIIRRGDIALSSLRLPKKSRRI